MPITPPDLSVFPVPSHVNAHLDVAGAPVTGANPVPVTVASGSGTQNVNVAQVAGVATPVGHGLAATALRVELPTDGTGVVGIIAGTASIGGTKDNGPQWTTAFGIAGVVFTSSDATTAAAVTSAPTAGQKLVITDLLMSTDTAMFLLFEEETSGTDLLKIFLPANGTYQFTPRSRLKLATADKKLTVDASVAGNIAITAFYYSEA